jgi:hypothetical protein
MKTTWIEMGDVVIGSWILIRRQPVQVTSCKSKQMQSGDEYVDIVAKDENGNAVKYSGYSDEGIQRIEGE